MQKHLRKLIWSNFKSGELKAYIDPFIHISDIFNSMKSTSDFKVN